jgi:hypothetical protein
MASKVSCAGVLIIDMNVLEGLDGYLSSTRLDQDGCV